MTTREDIERALAAADGAHPVRQCPAVAPLAAGAHRGAGDGAAGAEQGERPYPVRPRRTRGRPMTDPRLEQALADSGIGDMRPDMDANAIAATPDGASLLADAAVGAAVCEWVEYDGSISRHIDIEGGIGSIRLDLFDSDTGDIYARGATLAEAWADAMRQYHDEPSFVAELPEDRP